MDFKAFINNFKPMSCVLSVEKFPDGSFGNIRIVDGNDEYVFATEQYMQMDTENKFEKKFVPDSPYEKYLPKDLNMEDFVYRSAILGKTLRAYVRPEYFPFWVSLTMIPLKSDKENIGYCAYSQEASQSVNEADRANLSPEIMSSVLQTCLKLRETQDFQKTMDEIIEDIRKLCDADQCCILLSDLAERKLTVLCEAFKERVDVSARDLINDDYFSVVESWEETIAGSTCIIVKDAQEWEALKERNPLWYESLRATNVKNIALFPLKAAEGVLGYIWAVDFDKNNTVRIKETLELATYFIASEISNRQMMRRLKLLGSMDVLTGVLNRNAMNSRVDAICAGKEPGCETVGAVFADLNGLKRENDERGHSAGDLMLKKAALLLQKHFQGWDIYRAGGDEFVVLAPNVPEEELLRRARAMQNDPEGREGGVSFAVGCRSGAYSEIKNVMRVADELMYVDKDAFYRAHPELSRGRDSSSKR